MSSEINLILVIIPGNSGQNWGLGFGMDHFLPRSVGFVVDLSVKFQMLVYL